jgi:hypothetical protein
MIIKQLYLFPPPKLPVTIPHSSPSKYSLILLTEATYVRQYTEVIITYLCWYLSSFICIVHITLHQGLHKTITETLLSHSGQLDTKNVIHQRSVHSGDRDSNCVLYLVKVPKKDW